MAIQELNTVEMAEVSGGLFGLPNIGGIGIGDIDLGILLNDVLGIVTHTVSNVLTGHAIFGL